MTDVIKLQHIDNLREKVTERSDRAINSENPTNKIEKEGIEIIEEQDKVRRNTDGICPKCGSNLVLRTAKRGDSLGKQFYGCSNYPRCKFSRNL
ncbi:topoisomerase DNA-binding C4 zinc finger domain-containing protein [Niameybacter massiliensis]|uniref:topoisomerase DNA-binding C4 zinc finger domain-containing protein n=1 Tax=Niameybacter massiliensis TaxID=1658108 RepID=UPI0009E64BAE|nr:topoisomerase DNA-binding C4 zinc finger domain-containing protein [Niameybacter massiliensis]